jgi:hypothetical protein
LTVDPISADFSHSYVDINFNILCATKLRLVLCDDNNNKNTKKKLTHFAMKSSDITISYRTAGSTFDFLNSLIMLNFVIQGLYDVQITTNKFC